jgi:NADP oxidoreductase coenzyme F420-dependent
LFTSVGFIGSGEVAGALAPHLTTAGVPVLISNSRGPASLTDVVIELGDHAKAVTAAADAIRGRCDGQILSFCDYLATGASTRRPRRLSGTTTRERERPPSGARGRQARAARKAAQRVARLKQD